MPPAHVAEWASLLTVRDEALKVLEVARADKQIGGGLEAQLHIAAPEPLYSLLERHRDQLRYLFIVSDVVLEKAAAANGDTGVQIKVSKAPGAEVRALLELLDSRGRRYGVSDGLRAVQRGAGRDRSHADGPVEPHCSGSFGREAASNSCMSPERRFKVFDFRVRDSPTSSQFHAEVLPADCRIGHPARPPHQVGGGAIHSLAR